LWFREKFQENERKYFGAILLNQVPGLLWAMFIKIVFSLRVEVTFLLDSFI
jgi:hypothetical protein